MLGSKFPRSRPFCRWASAPSGGAGCEGWAGFTAQVRDQILKCHKDCRGCQNQGWQMGPMSPSALNPPVSTLPQSVRELAWLEPVDVNRSLTPPHPGAPRIPCFLVGEFGDQSWWGSGSQACSVRPQTTRGLTFRHQGARTMMGVLVFQSPGSGNQSCKSCLAGLCSRDGPPPLW